MSSRSVENPPVKVRKNGTRSIGEITPNNTHSRHETDDDPSQLPLVLPPFNFNKIDHQIVGSKLPEITIAEYDGQARETDAGYHLIQPITDENYYSEFSPSQLKTFRHVVNEIEQFVQLPLSAFGSYLPDNRANLIRLRDITRILPKLLELFILLEESDVYWQNRLPRINQEIKELLSNFTTSQIKTSLVSKLDSLEIAKQTTEICLKILRVLGYKFSLEPIQRKEPLIELARLGLQDKPEQVPKEVKIIDWGYYKDSARPRRPVYKEFNKLKQQKDQSTKLSKEKFRHLLIQDLSQEYLLQLMAFLAKPHLQFSSSPISSNQAWLRASASIPWQLVLRYNRNQPKEIRRARDLLLLFVKAIESNRNQAPEGFIELQSRIKNWLEITMPLFKIHYEIPASKLNQVNFSPEIQAEAIAPQAGGNFPRKKHVHPYHVMSNYKLLHGHIRRDQDNGEKSGEDGRSDANQAEENQSNAGRSNGGLANKGQSKNDQSYKEQSYNKPEVLYCFYAFEFLSPDKAPRFVNDLSQLVWEILFVFDYYLISRDNTGRIGNNT